jgi:hypothetical protein
MQAHVEVQFPCAFTTDLAINYITSDNPVHLNFTIPMMEDAATPSKLVSYWRGFNCYTGTGMSWPEGSPTLTIFEHNYEPCDIFSHIVPTHSR